jgi:hypothetical protein
MPLIFAFASASRLPAQATSSMTLLWPLPCLPRVITAPHTPQAAGPLASPACNAGSPLLLTVRENAHTDGTDQTFSSPT